MWDLAETLVGVGKDPLHSRRVLKTVRLTTIRNRPKRTISANGGFGLGLGLLHIKSLLFLELV